MNEACFSEDELIASLNLEAFQEKNIIRSIGEDCAVIESQISEEEYSLYKTESLVEGIHYLSGTRPELIGRKAIARVVSDFASMGGKLEYVQIAIGLPPSVRKEWVKRVYEGMGEILSEAGARIIGGDTVSLPETAPFFCSVHGIGKAKKAQILLRDKGKQGHEIWVTGKLGGSFQSEKHLTFSPRWREALWLTEHYPISAMIDLSDGLARDLPRLCQRSQCGFLYKSERIPLTEGISLEQAISEGEDYELLFCLSPENSDSLSEEWKKHFSLPLSKIGILCEKQKGQKFDIQGFDHFQKN